ncbi:MAG: sugar phosphate nucleotidyltransferase [Gemmatimonadota bacterium]
MARGCPVEAMILAAGVGKRLRPHTDRTPKALVEVAGIPMIARVARRLIEAGAERIVINLHHHAAQIEEYVRERDEFGVEVLFSREPEAPLETGGGLLAAAGLFQKRAPFFLHNVDVICDADLAAMYAAHRSRSPIATLAVNRRETSRPLLVDDDGFRGLANRGTGWRAEARPARGRTREIGFAGIHVLSPDVFSRITERGRFSIMDVYLRLAAEGCLIDTFDMSDALWLEVGDPKRLERARRALAVGGEPEEEEPLDA